MAAHFLTCRPAPVREAPQWQRPRPPTLPLGNQKNKTNQGNKGGKSQSIHPKTVAPPPSAPVGWSSSCCRCRAVATNLVRSLLSYERIWWRSGNAKHPVVQLSGRGRCSINKFSEPAAVLLIVPPVRLLAGTGRDGSVLESVWTGRTAVDGMGGHLLPSCDR